MGGLTGFQHVQPVSLHPSLEDEHKKGRVSALDHPDHARTAMFNVFIADSVVS